MAENVNEKASTSRELLDIQGSKAKRKEAAVYSLLHEKTKTKGTFKIEPSSTLMLVKQFLPKIQQENARMLQEIESSLVNKSKFDIENVEDANKPVIEMDFSLYEDTDCDSESEPETTEKIPGLDTRSKLVQELNEENKE